MSRRNPARWLRATKPRRAFAALLASVLLVLLHTVFAVKNAAQVIYLNYWKLGYNLRVLWRDYVPNGSAEMIDEPDCI